MNLFYRGALAALTLTLFLSGCSAPTFNGSRTGNDSQFLMEYTVLNTTDGQTLSLEAGDALDVAVVSASGAVSVNAASVCPGGRPHRAVLSGNSRGRGI